jgi:hypothetical protein
LTVAFTDQSTGWPTGWAWDFDGNGSVDSILPSTSFTYSDAGTYAVTLTVANASGFDSEVKSGYIAVTAPAVDPAPEPPPQPAPQPPAPPPRTSPAPPPTPRVTTYSRIPTADGRVGAARTPLLLAGGTSERGSYLVFSLAGVRGSVQRASLRLYASDGSGSRLTVQRCSAGWTEKQLGSGTKPRLLGRPLAYAQPIRRGRWLELRLPVAPVTGNGKLCLALLARGKDAVAFRSRESRTPPTLVLKTN